MLGVGLGLSQRQRQNVVFDWDFTKQTAGGATVPSGLAFSRTGSGYSVQDGDNAVLLSGGFTSDNVPRIGRLSSAHSYGMFLEPERTNLALHSRDQSNAVWNAGSLNTPTYNQFAGPDGQVLADRNVTTSGGYSKYQVLTLTVGQTYTASGWLRSVAASSEYRLALLLNASSWTYAGGPGYTVGQAWERKSLVRGISAGGATNVFMAFDGTARATPSVVAAQAADLYSDMLQVELGPSPSSYIPTTTTAVTRSLERLYMPQTEARSFLAGGRVGFYFKFRALRNIIGASTSTEGFLVRSVGITPAFSVQILGNSQQLVISDGVNQSITATLQFSFVIGDLVELWVEFGNGKSRVKWRINGGAVTTAIFSVVDQELDKLNPLVTGIDLLSYNTVGVTHSIVERVMALLPGESPL